MFGRAVNFYKGTVIHYRSDFKGLTLTVRCTLQTLLPHKGKREILKHSETLLQPNCPAIVHGTQVTAQVYL